MKSSTSYGYPLSSLILLINGLLLLNLGILLLVFLGELLFAGILLISIPLYIYFIVIRFKHRFNRFRHQTLQQMIKHAELNGTEIIADIGTGAGFIAIGFSKTLTTGKIYALDKYHENNQGILSRFNEEMKINFFGNTLQNAQHNAIIEQQQKKITFLQANLTKPFPFKTNYFDCIISSQFLYCIPKHQLDDTLIEIHRVLKPSGKIIFFESKGFLQWNLQHVITFYEQKNYTVKTHPVPFSNKKCLLIGTKPAH